MTQRILLVEDNELNRDMLSRRLARRGYEVALAEDGAQGVARARELAPGLVLMDLSLPEIDGIEAIRRLRADPATAAIPIIALTAHALSSDRDSALAAGASEFETKPVDFDRLVAKIEALLGADTPAGAAAAALASDDARFMRLAWEAARKSYLEGGLPIGAVMVEDGQVVATGHNRRVQDGDPTAHGEMDCIRRAGRRPDYRRVTLYTTLSPCMMCAGTAVQFGIGRVVVGEDRNFPGNADFLAAHGVAVTVLDDAECVALMRRFIEERPQLWNEDIAGRERV